jgi:hypothetical protein
MPINPLKEKLTDIGRPIAERILSIDGSEEMIRVRLGEPQPFADGQDWYCPYEVVRGEHRMVRFAAGVDSLQALQLALLGSASNVYVTNRELDHALRWYGNRELGFTSYDGEKF